MRPKKPPVVRLMRRLRIGEGLWFIHYGDGQGELTDGVTSIILTKVQVQHLKQTLNGIDTQ